MVEISRSMKARKNNAKGHMFESYINAACSYYKRTGQAVIEKIPEPFRTTATERDGTFSGRFTSNAKPDYIGTLKNGRSICFEAKYTTTDKMQEFIFLAQCNVVTVRGLMQKVVISIVKKRQSLILFITLKI